ncbi:hypothetical protein ACLQ28_29085 [Micromonospora sp. DT201]|uniref:hypothetical protein n=1 Tax=Micromonospora sp. DT201 TaxID=3393442 RepID=UPI003CF11A71
MRRAVGHALGVLGVLGGEALGGVEQFAGRGQLVVVDGGECQVDGITDALTVVAAARAGVGTKDEDALV